MKDRRMLHRVGWLAVVAGVVASIVPAAADAQFGVRTDGNGIFLPAPRELRRQVAQAAEAIADGNFSDAAEALGMILADTSTEDYFIDTGDDEAKTSLKAEAQRLLGTMPPRGRQQYEDRFGAEARRMYDDAVVSGNLRALADVTRMYFHTKAGHAATMLLGRYRLDEGRPLAAAMCFKRLADGQAASRFEPQLSILLAHCWQLTGRTEAAREVLVNLKRRSPETRLRVGGREVELFDDDQQALTWLAETFPSEIEGHQAKASQWLVHRGDPSRNASSKGGMPIKSLRWRVWTMSKRAEEERAVQLYTQYHDGDVPALPAFQPLAVQDLVLMRTPHHMMAVDFPTGKRIWEYPWYDSQLDSEETSGSLRSSGGLAEENLKKRLFEDAVYGQMASDGRSVYILDKVGYPRGNRTSGRVILMPGGNVRQQSDEGVNELVALDLKTQGKLRWIVGGKSGGDEAKLAGAFFLGPPLPVLGQLYVLAEFEDEIRLCVLDARTGALDWAQQLALLEGRPPIENDPMRRLAGATPSFSDGVLVCPTSAGAVVAVDVANRSLLWGHQYQQQPSINLRFRRRIPTTRQLAVGQRWADATATIDGGRVVLTPVEADEMLCLDLFTGRSLWEDNLPRGDRLFVAGIRNDRAIVVGKESVSAINLENAKPEWDTPLEGAPSGRGFISDGCYYQPTTDALLFKIDLRDGSLPIEPTRTDGILGNLICYQDEVISQGFDKDHKPQLTVYYQQDALRSKVSHALKADPNDSWAWARQGEMLRSEGRLAAAIDAFRKAYRYNESPEYLGLLVGAMVDSIDSDFAANRSLVEEAERLTRQTSWRADFLRAAAAGKQKAGQLEQALADYLQLISLTAAESQQDSPEIMQPGPGWQVRRGRWVRARLHELVRSSQSASSDQREAVERQIASRLAAAISSAGDAELRQFVDYFSEHPLADQARLGLAQRLIDQQRRMEAELLLAGLAHRGQESAAAARAMYCRLLERLGPTWEAADAYRDLAENYRDVVCLAGKTGAQLAAGVDPASPLGETLAAPAHWNRAKPDVSRSVYQQRNNRGVYQRVYPVNIPQWDLGGGERMFVRIDQSQQQIVLCRSTGEELARISSARDDRTHAFPNYSLVHAKGIGHLLVFSLGFEIVAVDVAEAQNDPAGAVVWRFDLAPVSSGGRSGIPLINATSKINPWGEPYYVPTDPLRRPFGQIASLSEAGVCFQHGQRLMCLDPLTGREIWSRGGVPEGCDVFGDEQFVFAIPPNSSSAAVYSTVDGSLLGNRPLEDGRQRWVTRGRNLLMWSEQGGSLDLQLVDLWNGDMLLQRSYAEGTRASLVSNAEVAVYERSGRFAVFGLEDGKERISITLDAEPNLTSIYVLRRDRQYLVMTNRPITSPLADTNVQAAPGGFYAPLVHGKLYALDAVSGKPRWAAPVEIEQQGFPLDQPSGTPLLVLLRHLNSTDGAARPTRTSLQCIDVRDGSEIYRDEFIATTSSYQIIGDPASQTVKLNLPARNYTFRFHKKQAVAPAGG